MGFRLNQSKNKNYFMKKSLKSFVLRPMRGSNSCTSYIMPWASIVSSRIVWLLPVLDAVSLIVSCWSLVVGQSQSGFLMDKSCCSSGMSVLVSGWRPFGESWIVVSSRTFRQLYLLLWHDVKDRSCFHLLLFIVAIKSGLWHHYKYIFLSGLYFWNYSWDFLFCEVLSAWNSFRTPLL